MSALNVDLVQLQVDLAVLMQSATLHSLPYIPDSISTTTACVRPGSPWVDFHATFDAVVVNLEVILLVGKNIDSDWQATLAGLISSGQVVDAIETDPRFQVNSAGPLGTTTVGDTEAGSIILSVSALP